MIEYAAELSKLGEHKHKVGCVVTDRRGRVLSTGYCQMKTHPIQAKYARRCNDDERVYLHAEIAALVKCRAKPYAIFVVRMNRYGFANARPCPICTEAIREAGIKMVHYTDQRGQVVSQHIEEFLAEK